MADSELSAGPTGGRAAAKGEAEPRELSKQQAAVARRVAESKATIPHGYAHRQVELPGAEAHTARVIAALGSALAGTPELNAAYRDGSVMRYSRVNVGFLLETGQGTLVPTLFDADKMTMDQVEQRLLELSARAAEGALTAPELSGGTCSAGPAGAGADAAAGIVIPGQVAHLAIGRAREAALARAGELRAGLVCDLTLSFDQRAVRPPLAASLLGEIAGHVEGR